eukprot:15472568-Alexandrium_andersonii.AAC.1
MPAWPPWVNEWVRLPSQLQRACSTRAIIEVCPRTRCLHPESWQQHEVHVPSLRCARTCHVCARTNPVRA